MIRGIGRRYAAGARRIALAAGLAFALAAGYTGGTVSTGRAASWEDYVAVLLESEMFDHVALVGHNATLWAGTVNFSIHAGEVDALNKGFAKPALFRDGFALSGSPYAFDHTGEDALFGKSGDVYAIVYQTKRAYLIGITKPKASLHDADFAIGDIADALIRMRH
jgi:hypothetical protein